MKHYYIALVAIGLAFNSTVNSTVNAQVSNPLVKSNATQNVDSIIQRNAAENVSKTVYTYTDDKKVSEELVYTWNALSKDWTNFSKTSNTYDAAGNKTAVITQKWDGKVWNDSIKITSTYNDQGHILSYDLRDLLVNRHRVEEYTYNGLNGVEIYVDTTRTSETAFTVIRGKIETEYMENGQIKSYINYNKNSNEADKDEWVFNNKLTYTYDDQGRLSETSLDNATYQLGKWIYSYTDNSELMQLYQRFSADADLALLSETLTETEGENPVTTTVKVKNYWDNENPEWVVTSQTYTYYPENSSTQVETPVLENVRVYSQDGILYVETPENMSVQVYSILGGCYYNAFVNGSAQISKLQSGIYLVRINQKSVKVRI